MTYDYSKNFNLDLANTYFDVFVSGLALRFWSTDVKKCKSGRLRRLTIMRVHYLTFAYSGAKMRNLIVVKRRGLDEILI